MWKPQPHWLVALVGWGTWSQREARVAPVANGEVAQLTERLYEVWSLLGSEILPYLYIRLQQTGDQDGDPAGEPVKGTPEFRSRNELLL